MMRQIIGTLAILVIGICALLLVMTPADAREFKLIELKESTIGYKQFLPGSHSLLLNESGLDNRRLDKQVNLYFNMDLAKYLYWDNRVHGTTDESMENGKGTGKGQFRMVGWEFQFGLRPSKYLSVEYGHHSQHLLDHQRPGRFPVEDSVGIKIHLYKSPAARDTIF